MENRDKIRELLASMDDAERQLLNEELHASHLSDNAGTTNRVRVAVEEITTANLSDPEFSQRVRNEINLALRGEI